MASSATVITSHKLHRAILCRPHRPTNIIIFPSASSLDRRCSHHHQQRFHSGLSVNFLPFTITLADSVAVKVHEKHHDDERSLVGFVVLALFAPVQWIRCDVDTAIAFSLLNKSNQSIHANFGIIGVECGHSRGLARGVDVLQQCTGSEPAVG